MANPSLQIGNSNWAIKEDNLLGYSTVGTNYLPKPMTMTRESAGTRVNSSGLVETVELLGSEEITGFTNGTSYPFSTFTTSGNNITSAIISSSFAGAVSNSISIVNGKTYKVTFTYTKNSGDDLRVLISNSISGAGTSISNIEQVSASGDITLFFTATSTTTGYLQMGTGSGSDSLDISITNISVKESTKNNLARVDYDGTASSLLVEPERTNLVTYSEDFSNGWAYFDSSTDANELISPSGVLDASKFIEGNGSSIKRIINLSQSIVSGNDYTFSIFAKKGERDFITLTNSTGTADVTTTFDLTNGTVTSGIGTIESLTNGWFRCSRSFTATATVTSNYIVQAFINNGSGISYQGDGTSGLYIWGVDFQKGSYPTSYIPTDGGTVTRNQDQYSKTGISNLINSEEGVLFLEATREDNTNYISKITLNDGSKVNQLVIQYRFGYNLVANLTIASASTSISTNTLTPVSNKIAIVWAFNRLELWVNGSKIGEITTAGTFPANTLSRLMFSEGDGTDDFFGKIKQLQVFKTALTDTELITLTT